jgi:hypothetical protein
MGAGLRRVSARGDVLAGDEHLYFRKREDASIAWQLNAHETRGPAGLRLIGCEQ